MRKREKMVEEKNERKDLNIKVMGQSVTDFLRQPMENLQEN